MHSVASMHGNGFWLLGCRSFFEPLEMSQKWLSTQNELNDVMFQMRQTPTILTF